MAGQPESVTLAEQALLLAERGALEWAHTLASQALLQLAAAAQPAPEERDAVAQALCLTALRMLQAGLDAGGLLRALGARRTLAPAVLAHRPAALQPLAPDSSPPVALLTDVLPDALLETLQHGLRPDGPYWEAHRYWDTATPFSSHLLPSLEGGGSSAIQQAASLVHGQLRRLWPEAAGRAVAAEVWAHCRDPRQPHQLHWDTDESQLGSRARGRSSATLPHPELSTVLFLDCCRCAGPTAVLSERLSSHRSGSGSGAAGGGTAWLAHPVQGALLAFRGGLLHGVLPGGCLRCASHRPRLTLMCALWGACMAVRTPAAGSLGPAMPLPEPATAWLSELPACAASLQRPHRQAQAWEVPAVQPAWVGLCDRSEAGQGEAPLRTAALPDLRFFSREEGELQRRYLPSW